MPLYIVQGKVIGESNSINRKLNGPGIGDCLITSSLQVVSWS